MKITTVRELIAMLWKFDENLPVTISDGHELAFYAGEYTIGLYDDFDCVEELGHTMVCDIGIGGTKLHESN